MKRFFTVILGLSCLTATPVISQTLVESQQDFIHVKTPEQLTWKNFEAVAKHAAQDKQEKLYHSIQWENSVIEAQQSAFKADKPILMILFFGDHRINC